MTQKEQGATGVEYFWHLKKVFFSFTNHNFCNHWHSIYSKLWQIRVFYDLIGIQIESRESVSNNEPNNEFRLSDGIKDQITKICQIW